MFDSYRAVVYAGRVEIFYTTYSARMLCNKYLFVGGIVRGKKVKLSL
jgi:hypothetical protein